MHFRESAHALRDRVEASLALRRHFHFDDRRNLLRVELLLVEDGLVAADDAALFVEGRTLREVASFVSERLSPLEGVLSTSTHFMLKTYKRLGVLMHQESPDERLSVSP